LRKPADQDPELYALALEAVRRYRAHLTSEESIARFAVWFASKQPWKDITKNPPRNDLLILLYDPTHRIVRLGYIAVNGFNIIGDTPHETFVPRLWHAISYQ
jgi:hypothetical protein